MIMKTGKVRLCTLCNCLTNIHLFASLTEQLPSSASFSHFTFLLFQDNILHSCFVSGQLFYILAIFQDKYFTFLLCLGRILFTFLLCFKTIILHSYYVSGQFNILSMFWDNYFTFSFMFQDNFPLA